MAGRNAINKPKIKLHAQSHAKSLGRKELYVELRLQDRPLLDMPPKEPLHQDQQTPKQLLYILETLLSQPRP